MKYGIALIEKPEEEGLNREELIDLYSRVAGTPGAANKVFPLELLSKNTRSAMMGLITTDAARLLSFEYDKLNEYLCSFLEAPQRKFMNSNYTFEGIEIYMRMSSSVRKIEEPEDPDAKTMMYCGTPMLTHEISGAGSPCRQKLAVLPDKEAPDEDDATEYSCPVCNSVVREMKKREKLGDKSVRFVKISFPEGTKCCPTCGINLVWSK